MATSLLIVHPLKLLNAATQEADKCFSWIIWDLYTWWAEILKGGEKALAITWKVIITEMCWENEALFCQPGEREKRRLPIEQGFGNSTKAAGSERMKRTQWFIFKGLERLFAFVVSAAGPTWVCVDPTAGQTVARLHCPTEYSCWGYYQTPEAEEGWYFRMFENKQRRLGYPAQTEINQQIPSTAAFIYESFS